MTEDTEILDVGCGSGILGMLALKFGAKHSVGTDLDPCAIDATYENMDNNGISRDQYEVMIGNIIDDKEVQDKVGYEIRYRSSKYPGRCTGTADTCDHPPVEKRAVSISQAESSKIKKKWS